MQQLSNPGDLIAASWANFVRNFRTYVDFAVWLVLLSIVQWGLTVGVVAAIDDIFARNAVLSIAMLPVALAALAVIASLIDATYQGVLGKPVDRKASFSHGLHKLVPFVAVTLALAATYAAGILLLFVPVFVFAVWFWFAPFHTVVEGKHAFAAMGASRKLVSGRWWATAIRLLLPAVFFIVAAVFVRNLLFLVLGFAFGEPGAFIDAISLRETMSNTQLLLQSVVPSTVNAFLMPLLYGSYLLLWDDLKKTR